jgi:serine/threonine protein phosphatase 1
MDAKTNHPDWIFLRGNHDQMLIDLILGRSSTTEIGNVLGMEFGYEQASKSFQEWQNLMKHDRNEVLSFLEGTQFFYETEEFIFCHAVLRENNNSIESKAPEELMWNYSYEPIWRGKKFVHGHLPVKVPTITRQGININTECGYGGELTGFYYGAQNQIIRYYRIKENGQLINK